MCIFKWHGNNRFNAKRKKTHQSSSPSSSSPSSHSSPLSLAESRNSSLRSLSKQTIEKTKSEIRLDLKHIDAEQEIKEIAKEALRGLFGDDHNIKFVRKHIQEKIREWRASENEDAKKQFEELLHQAWSNRDKNRPELWNDSQHTSSELSMTSPYIRKLFCEALNKYHQQQRKQENKQALLIKVLLGVAGLGVTAAPGLLSAWLTSQK